MDVEITAALLIFFARVVDVSLGTVRVILIIRGYRYIAPVLGFIEILIWLTAISRVFQNLSGWHNFIAYAGGYAAGNYVGMLIEARLAIGYQSIRVITTKKVSALPMTLCDEGFGVTRFSGQGAKGDVSLLFTVVQKKNVTRVLEIVRELEPEAFITIEDIRSFYGGYVSKKNFADLFGRMVQKKK